MKLESPDNFPSGIIEIFKLHRIYDLNMRDCNKKGEVKSELVTNT